jgi:hypothetical protein
MAWHEPITKFTPNALVGIGLVLAAPIVLPIVRDALRPVAKSAIKGYLTLQDTVTEWAAATGEQVSDLVAEASAEHAAPPADETVAESRSPRSASSTGGARKKV